MQVRELPIESCSRHQEVLSKRVRDAFLRGLHAALKQTNIAEHPMYGGPITFDAKGQNVNIGVPLLQNQNQQPVVIPRISG